MDQRPEHRAVAVGGEAAAPTALAVQVEDEVGVGARVIAAGREVQERAVRRRDDPVGHGLGEGAHHRLADARRGLDVATDDRSGMDRVHDRPRRRDHRDRPVAAVVGRNVGRHQLEQRAVHVRRGDRVGGVDRPERLRRRPGEVSDHIAAGDRHGHRHRERDRRVAVVLEPLHELILAVGDLLDLLAHAPLGVVLDLLEHALNVSRPWPRTSSSTRRSPVRSDPSIARKSPRAESGSRTLARISRHTSSTSSPARAISTGGTHTPSWNTSVASPKKLPGTDPPTST